MGDGDSSQGERFPSTHWSMVARIADDDPQARREALEGLLRRYLPACRAHLLLRKRLPLQQVDDLLQGFVCDRILGANVVAQADPGRGRLRTFLLTTLNNYLAQVRRGELALCRTPASPLLGLEEAEEEPEAPSPCSDVFDQEWARQVVQQAAEHMRRQCQGQRQRLWELFECRVLGPIMHNTPPIAYEQLVQRFGFASPVQAANALITAKRMFGRALESIIGQYAVGEAEVEAEMRDLWRIVAGGRGNLLTFSELAQDRAGDGI